VPDQTTALDIEMAGEAESQLKQIAQECALRGVNPELRVEEGILAETILALVQKEKIDLVVMGTHGRRGLDHLMLGSITEKVLRKSSCPVLAVRKPAHDFVDPAQSGDPVSLRKVLFGTDFSPTAGKALPYALSLAREYDAELTVLHVLEGISTTEFVQEGREKALRDIESSIPAEARAGCNFRMLVRVGKSYEQIIQLAIEEQTDLVVLGVRGRMALDLALFGSTTHRVLQLGPCPVLTVKT
jgi:nucleotide-binding universal stress UspA family protein